MKRSSMITALLAAGAVCSAVLAPSGPAISATPATYHVDCRQKVGGDGSEKKPFNSITTVNLHGDYLPGEQILFKRGSTCKGRLAPAGSGAKGHPVVIGAYGKGAKPVINGGGTPDRTAVVMLTNQQYWTVQDLQLTNTSGGKTTERYRSGVLLRNWFAPRLSGLTVQRLTITSVVSNMGRKKADPREWGGISVLTNGQKGDGFSGLKILKNRIGHVGRTGIILSNLAYGNGGYDQAPQVSGNVVTSTRGDGIVVRGSHDARIDHNTVAHASSQWPCSQCGKISPATANAAIWTSASQRTRIDHNEAYGTKFLGGDGEGFDIDASAVDSVVEYNYAHDNEGGGILFCGSRNAVARFNIFENNKRSAIAFIGSMPARNTQIYNNTIYSSRASGANVVRTFNGLHGSGVTFRNNVVYSYTKGHYTWPTRPKTSANTLIGSHAKGRPADSRTSWRDPGLRAPGTGGTGFGSLGGYRLRHSPAAVRGVAIPSGVNRDFFGRKISAKKPPRGAAG